MSLTYRHDLHVRNEEAHVSDEGPSSQEHIGPHVRVYGGARRGSFWGIVSLVVMCQ